MLPFLLLTAAFPALAQETSDTGKKSRDPNQMVCEKQEVLGSRLAVRKICMTRAEWAAKRAGDRDLTQATQAGVRQQNPCSRNGC